MTDTPGLGLLLMATNQSQKEEVFNRAIVALDAVLVGVIDINYASEPSSYSNGDSYIVSSSGASGSFTGKEKNIAYYFNGWKFIAPQEGLSVWVNSQGAQYVYNGTSWVKGASLNDLSDVAISSATTYDLLQHNGTAFANTKNIDNLSRLGVNTTADSTNKLALKSNSSLFSAVYAAESGNGDILCKINKESSTDTASIQLQQNFSSFAELGLAGNNDLSIKVSPDNFTTTYNALTIDKDNGYIGLNNTNPSEILHMVSSTTNPKFLLDQMGSGEGPELRIRKSRGSVATPTTVANGDVLYDNFIFGHNGTDFQTAALIRTQVDGTPSTLCPAKLMFYVATTSALNQVAEMNNVGDLILPLVGGGLKIKEGTNSKMGWATLSSGTATINTTKVTANSRIFLTNNSPSGTPGFLYISARTAGTSFTVTSSAGAADTSTFAWIIFEPA